MGCDIHIVIQAQEADGTWIEVPWQREAYDYNGARPNVDGVPIAPRCFGGRNYDTFAILADVRNGSGFAGIKTGEGWPSIAPHRGFPDGFRMIDVAPDPLYPEDGQRYLGDHSQTWLTLDELRAYGWDTTATRQYGVVPADVYESLEGTHQRPATYCGDTAGPGIQVYTPETYRVAHAAGTLAPRPYVRMHWTETAREATGDFPGLAIPWLETIAAGRPLRLVLGFDS